MLKKGMYACFICLLLMGMAGCSKQGDEPSEETSSIQVTKMDAEQIVTMLQESGLPISDVIVYTEETDVNELLNRPGGYTSKVNFADRRISQSNTETPDGGTVEVFASSEDAKDRYEYVDSVAKGPLAQYMYLYENVFLRLDRQLTNAEAGQYEAAFKAMQEGNEPEKVEYAPQSVKEKLIYIGYRDVSENMYSKKVDDETEYFIDLTNQTFRIYSGSDDLCSYNWSTNENYADALSIFNTELEAAGLSIEELGE